MGTNGACHMQEHRRVSMGHEPAVTSTNQSVPNHCRGFPVLGANGVFIKCIPYHFLNV